MARRRYDRDDDYMFYDNDTEPLNRRGSSPEFYDDVRKPNRGNGNRSLLTVLIVIVLLLVGIAAGAVLYRTLSFSGQSSSVTSESSNGTVSQSDGAASDSSGNGVTGEDSAENGSNSSTSGSSAGNLSGNTATNSTESAVGSIQTGAPVFPHLSASSELKPMSKYSYYVSRLVDGDFSTAWIEGVSGYGAGQTVTFTADRQQLVSGIRIMNGYCRNEDRYYRNSRVKTLRIEIPNDGTSSFDIQLKDQYRTWNNIQFDDPIPSDQVTLTILDVYPGTQYEDTGLAEIEFY